jgi:hypothetical protein
LIACYKVEAGGTGTLQVFDLDQRRRVAQQPVQTRVLFWRWLSRHQVALVTQRAIFTWNVVASSSSTGSSEVPRGTPPVKVFARQDTTTSTPSSGQEVVVRVRNYHHAAGGEWGVLTTTEEDRGEGGSSTQGVVVVQFHHLLHQHIVITESGAGLVDGNVGYCGDRLYFGLLYQESLPLSTSTSSDSNSFILQLSLLQEGGAQDGLTKVARLPVPGAPGAPRTRQTRSWVLFPPGGKSFMGVLLGEGGLLYTYDPTGGEGLLQPRGSVFPPTGPLPDAETRVVREVCWDEETGGLLVLEDQSLSVFRVML